jgi:His/Glu/Gln/Arg/opine family amino acid ABC transporter permease subunit
MLYAGLTFTIPLTLITFVLGLILGFVVALIRLYGPAPLKSAVRFYVWIIRGTPLLVQLFLIFYALPNAGITLDAFPSAVIGFTLNIGAYTSEVIRATLALGAKRPVGGGALHQHELEPVAAPHHSATGGARGGAAIIKHLYFAG